MGKIYSYIAAAFSMVAIFPACHQEENREYEYAEPVDLVMTIEGTNVVIGDEVSVKFATANAEEVSKEDFSIRLSATENNVDVTDSLFENFVSKVVFENGKNETVAKFPVRNGGFEGSHIVTLRAFARGYKISGESQNIKVGDYHYVTVEIENNTENKVDEGADFVLMASMEIPAPEDISVSFVPQNGQESYYGNLPSQLTIAKGQTSVKSAPVTMVEDGGAFDNVTLILDMTCSVADVYPLRSNSLSIERADLDKPLGALIEDERHVYPRPSVALLSNKNKDAVAEWNGCSTVLVERGAYEHPTRPGYKLLNAMEFHYIDFMMRGATVAKGNQFGVRPPKGLAAQNTAKVQENIAVNIDKFSTLTPEGYLKIWAAKDRNQATGGSTAWKDYGTACFFASKFNPAGMPDNHTNIPMHTRIYPGTRAEARIRMGGERNGFNAAFWFQGNNNIGANGIPWPTCGEIDVMENPVGKATGNAAWQTFHLGNRAGKETKSGSSGAKKVEMTQWNIYWFEWSSDGNTVSMGINGETTITLTRNQVEKNGGIWPFCKEENPEGLHMILTLVAPSAWPLGFSGQDMWTPPAGWDSNFADISYEESKTHKDTPKMEVDWIRFYKTAEYSDDGKKYNKNFYF